MQTTERTRYSDAELADFRTLIVGRIGEAQQQLEYYLNQLAEQTNGADGKVRGLDDSVISVANENLHNLANRQRKLIQHLEHALMRIDNKVYGICRQTGKLISKERLMSVPHTTLSIYAKQNR